MIRFSIWFMTLMDRWMAWLEQPFLPQCDAQLGFPSSVTCERKLGHDGYHRSANATWNYDAREKA